MTHTPAHRARGDDDPRTVDRLELVGAVLGDSRCRLIHAKIAWHLQSLYYAKFGNARASVRTLAKATGLTHGSVVTATADLCAWGYFTRDVGSGKAASTYVPVWEMASVRRSPSALPPPNEGVLPPPNEGILPPPNATGISVQPPPNDSHLLSAATAAATVNESTHTPHVAGLSAAPGECDLSGEIAAATVETVGDAMVLKLTVGSTEVAVIAQHSDARLQDAGQIELASLASALDLPAVDDPAEIVGRRVTVRRRTASDENREVRMVTSFHPAPPLPANDNVQFPAMTA